MVWLVVNGDPKETHDGRADMTNFEMDLFDTRMTEIKVEKEEKATYCCGYRASRNRIIKPACVPISIISLFIIALVFLPLFNEEDLSSPFKLPTECPNSCSSSLVESIPTGLQLPPPHYNSTSDAWISLVDGARKYIDISVMYWNLNTSDYSTAIYGRRFYEALIRAGRRGVKIRIAQDGSGSGLSDNAESKYLADQGLAEVRSINVSRLLGTGIIHTKFLIVDIENVYVGSANMDWKSLSEVKELGMVVENCPCVAADLYRIFAIYWKLGEPDAKIPEHWPISYRTPYNFSHPSHVKLNGNLSEFFISSSPGPFNPKGREHDLAAILQVIGSAKRSVCVSVMDYAPQTFYMKNNTFWPLIDDALRAAAFRGVAVRLLVSHWDHSRPSIIPFLRSLVAINDAMPKTSTGFGSINVKMFTVPATPEQKKNPFTRVNHAKFMVTDDTAYVGTSNWSGDYFISTAGVALVVRQKAASRQLQEVFDRDWGSPYAASLTASPLRF
ncbi:unnamed protein product [Caenorhabditis auriculariae]|uniref:PLD phosphodiesterase domain-containing protein n=1 Tax=Caenorhabditis auriculariae TaxID=2777116 RepID=A0A8S1H7A4_9PELO|nr:unnamed protein product [Caenorhabditis auriculariae]